MVLILHLIVYLYLKISYLLIYIVWYCGIPRYVEKTTNTAGWPAPLHRYTVTGMVWRNVTRGVTRVTPYLVQSWSLGGPGTGLLGNAEGNPGVFQGNPHPYPWKLVNATGFQTHTGQDDGYARVRVRIPVPASFQKSPRTLKTDENWMRYC